MLTMETSRGISNMVVNALLPCLVFNKIVTNLSGSEIKEIGIVILTALLVFGTGGMLGLIATYVTPVPPKWKWGLIFGGIFANISDLPIAYTQSMATGVVFDEKDTDKGVALSCIFLACQQFLMMNAGMFQLVGLDFREDKDVEKQQNNSENQNVDEDKNSEFNVMPLVRDEDEESDEISERSYSTRKRRRRSSATSRATFSRVRSIDSSYSTRSRRNKIQNIQSLVDEYSEADRLKSQKIDLGRTVSKTQEIGLNLDIDEEELEKTKPKHPKWNAFIKKYKLAWFEYILINLSRPASIVLLISFFVSMIPWIRALFVKNSINIHSAPDKLPPLNFVMDFTIYAGNSAIPMGLLLLGGTIARLEIQQIPKGFWKTSLFMIVSRLVIMPILGVLWTNRLYSAGWITDDISRFVFIISWSVPSATAQVYFTAFYTPLEGDHIQMDCLAIFLIMQYPILVITLAMTVSYTLKVNLGY